MKLLLRSVMLLLALSPLHAALGSGMLPVQSEHGMVVSVHELASDAGVEVLKAGGNAIDAAVATGFALAVVHPAAGNIGGGGFMLIRMHTGEVHFLDFREKAPGAATSAMYQDSEGNVVTDLSTTGYRASGVPGSVKGLVLAERRFGKLGLKRVMAPAIRLARRGFPIAWNDSLAMSRDDRLAQFPDSYRIFQNHGQGWRHGDLFKQAELAKTLERIAASPDDFYTGKMAREIADFMRRSGGLISAADLSSYEVKERVPVRGTYRGLEIISAPPPSSGGIALIETLNILEGFDLGQSGLGSAESIHVITEAFRRAFYDRAQFLGDPDFSDLPVSDLVGKEYAERWRRSIDVAKASPSAELERPAVSPRLARYAKEHPVRATSHESSETTHYSVVDADGSAVSVTTTLNGPFGSGVTVGHLGFLLNNVMDDFAAKPGAPNTFGLIQSDANAVGPYKRPLSAMTPTIVLKEGKLWLVLGTPGGPTIITTVAEILIGVTDYGLDIQAAVNAPRFHHQWAPDRLFLEPDRVSVDTSRLLQSRGHVIEWRGRSDGECIAIDLQTGTRLGASDGRNESGKAAGY